MLWRDSLPAGLKMIIFRQYIWRVGNFKYAEHIGNIALSVLGSDPRH